MKQSIHSAFHTRNDFQILPGHPGAFPSYLRHTILPANSGFPQGVIPVKSSEPPKGLQSASSSDAQAISAGSFQHPLPGGHSIPQQPPYTLYDCIIQLLWVNITDQDNMHCELSACLPTCWKYNRSSMLTFELKVSYTYCSCTLATFSWFILRRYSIAHSTTLFDLAREPCVTIKKTCFSSTTELPA